MLVISGQHLNFNAENFEVPWLEKGLDQFSCLQ